MQQDMRGRGQESHHHLCRRDWDPQGHGLVPRGGAARPNAVQPDTLQLLQHHQLCWPGMEVARPWCQVACAVSDYFAAVTCRQYGPSCLPDWSCLAGMGVGKDKVISHVLCTVLLQMSANLCAAKFISHAALLDQRMLCGVHHLDTVYFLLPIPCCLESITMLCRACARMGSVCARKATRVTTARLLQHALASWTRTAIAVQMAS